MTAADANFGPHRCTQSSQRCGPKLEGWGGTEDDVWLSYARVKIT